MTSDFGPWDPLSPTALAAELRPTGARWCIAGGWALELVAGRSWRDHDDVDAVILRAEAESVHAALAEWSLHLAGSGHLGRWPEATALPTEIHNIWVRQDGGPWRFQLMVIDADDYDWLYRRDPRIRGPLSTLTVDVNGLPVLVPELQLLYKSKQPNRPKDEQDFIETVPALDRVQRDRLATWLRTVYGSHPWLTHLAELD